jgi:tRNA1(Val) A37 N6-methylase TrmN6
MVEADQSGSGIATTCDAFLAGRVMVLQPKTGYRAGLDAVILAATVPAATSDQPPLKGSI